MKRLLIAVFLLVALPSVAQDFSLFEKKEFVSAEGETLPYRILYPENYE